MAAGAADDLMWEVPGPDGVQLRVKCGRNRDWYVGAEIKEYKNAGLPGGDPVPDCLDGHRTCWATPGSASA